MVLLKHFSPSRRPQTPRLQQPHASATSPKEHSAPDLGHLVSSQSGQSWWCLSRWTWGVAPTSVATSRSVRAAVCMAKLGNTVAAAANGTSAINTRLSLTSLASWSTRGGMCYSLRRAEKKRSRELPVSWRNSILNNLYLTSYFFNFTLRYVGCDSLVVSLINIFRIEILIMIYFNHKSNL